MSILLSCRDLAKRFGVRPLFDGLSFGLSEGERTGLIGPNGTGKSTLLKILAGIETPDAGEVAMRRGLRVRYLAQTDFFAEAPRGGTVREELTHALQGLGLEDYEIDMRIDDWLERSAFRADQAVNELSGGWRKRLAILSQVITEPDLLLLDEPTNHLDVAGVLWLEHLLSGIAFSFLVVTHDRRFLESVCNRVIELNKRYADGYFSSAGTYSQFIENREALFDAQMASEEKTHNVVRQEIAWLRRGAKARTTKQKAHIDRAHAKIAELGELEYRNRQDRAAAIDFVGSDRQTKRFIQGIGIEKGWNGKRLFGPLDLWLGPGDKLGLLGGNGSGKSTLLKLLTGELAPDAGTFRRADGLKVVTFDQHRDQLDLNLTLRRALSDSGEYVLFKERPMHVAAWAERFLFSKQQLEIPLHRLSGGEQARVLIARLMLKPADVLLLDEPTNDLDIQSLEILESSLREFPGALVLVTHDRYLLDRVSQNILALDGKGHAAYYADLAQWEDLQDMAPEDPPAPPAKEPPRPATAPRSGLSKQELKELKTVEAKLRAAESQVSAARAALDDPAIAADAGELLARHKTLEAAQQTVDALFARWEALESRRSELQ